VTENVKAAGVKLPAEVLKQIDDVLGEYVIRDPERTVSPATRP
jgi:hypothetical protein